MLPVLESRFYSHPLLSGFEDGMDMEMLQSTPHEVGGRCDRNVNQYLQGAQSGYAMSVVGESDVRYGIIRPTATQGVW
jgi:hypothetical protein